ncbi:hypothetical protein B0H14DRAFT_2631096 [Mycena olivaceomarginata]|nr:hypothetical protein B0H14DRAFT_2631096 [Mycena olivaceomarginata]
MAITHRLSQEARDKGETYNARDEQIKPVETHSLRRRRRVSSMISRKARTPRSTVLRATNKAVALDAMQTTSQIGRVIIALHSRTAVRGLLCSRGGHPDDSAMPSFVESGRSKVNSSRTHRLLCMGRCAEIRVYGSCNRDKMNNRNDIDAVRKYITELVEGALPYISLLLKLNAHGKITGDKTVTMSWTNYRIDIVHTLGVEMAGWPSSVVMVRPSKMAADVARRILDKLRSGAIHGCAYKGPNGRRVGRGRSRRCGESGAVNSSGSSVVTRTSRAGRAARRATKGATPNASEDDSEEEPMDTTPPVPPPRAPDNHPPVPLPVRPPPPHPLPVRPPPRNPLPVRPTTPVLRSPRAHRPYIHSPRSHRPHIRSPCAPPPPAVRSPPFQHPRIRSPPIQRPRVDVQRPRVRFPRARHGGVCGRWAVADISGRDVGCPWLYTSSHFPLQWNHYLHRHPSSPFRNAGRLQPHLPSFLPVHLCNDHFDFDFAGMDFGLMPMALFPSSTSTPQLGLSADELTNDGAIVRINASNHEDLDFANAAFTFDGGFNGWATGAPVTPSPLFAYNSMGGAPSAHASGETAGYVGATDNLFRGVAHVPPTASGPGRSCRSSLWPPTTRTPGRQKEEG